MLALIAAILIGLHAIGLPDPGQISLFDLGLAFWAAHFAFALAVPFARQRQP